MEIIKWVKALVIWFLPHLPLLIGMSSFGNAQRCIDTGNFTTNSTYGRNRDLILTSLPANVSENGGFFNGSMGQDSNKVYALGVCRGDYSPDACYSCINSSIHDLITKCPNQKEAVAWGYCTVRYAARWIFGILELNPSQAGYNTGFIGSNITEFDQVWESLLDKVVRKASTGSSRLKYATGETELNTFRKIYAQMQCTPDLSMKDCDYCLRQSVSYYQTCCHGKQGGYVQRPSCFFRWDLYPFYQSNSSTSANTPFLSPPPPPPPSPPPANSTDTKEGGGISSQTLVIIVVPIVIFVALVILALVLLNKRKKPKRDDKNDKSQEESLQFHFNAIKLATDNFSDTNLLGKGGFGFVYKGKLPDGQDIAVKRLSGSSGQGEREFKTEVLLMAKLQHRNLVRLLGFSWEQRERILIYEFLPNLSLDHFIFDQIKRIHLNWDKRYKIIEGIAKGLLYLHEDSRYRIIHRDLKASNILLDAEMNPKIADFGMAKLFTADQTRSDSSRIVGTFGYIAPECVRGGHYSVKSDVYGFGVLVLEIISGKKISSFSSHQADESLIIDAWKNWNEGTPLKLIDPILRDGSRSEMIKCLHLALLCVQENAAYRPTMASIVLMLSSCSISLPAPSRPAFLLNTINESESSSIDQSQSNPPQISVNEASISELDPR